MQDFIIYGFEFNWENRTVDVAKARSEFRWIPCDDFKAVSGSLFFVSVDGERFYPNQLNIVRDEEIEIPSNISLYEAGTMYYHELETPIQWEGDDVKDVVIHVAWLGARDGYDVEIISKVEVKGKTIYEFEW